MNLWNKTKREDYDTKCFIYVEISDDKVKEGVSDENTLKKCDDFINTTKPFYEGLNVTLGNKFVKIDGSKSEDESYSDIK